MKFTFGSGQKPLDGYTIKRGVGKGGFGEVYFAVSDGGKEVALKLIRGDGAVELRGIAQCLNLKHANLVNLFDLRTDQDGNQWVVMEYVAGEPLHQVLARYPNGLPVELTKQWFLALARAVGYLHDHGIVHRDLKPANIFLEDGIIKVGDYGLCKSISSSQRTAQTQSVGTVHYMAPEISTGNYGKQIDVYSCGILLYEMLAGKVPFDGETAGEILMKHLTKAPDVSGLPFEYVPIVAKALAKNPAQRYPSMAEMTQAIEALHAPVPSAKRPAVKPGSPPPLPTALAAPPGRRPAPPIPPVNVEPPVPVPVRGQVGELAGSLALSTVLALLTTTIWAAVLRVGEWNWIGSLFFLTVAVSWAVLVPSKFWDERVTDAWSRRLFMMLVGAGVGVGALWLDGWTPDGLRFLRGFDLGGMSDDPLLNAWSGHGTVATGAGYVSYFGLALGLMRWWRLADRRRSAWFSLFPVLAAGFWGLGLLCVWPWYTYSPVFGHGSNPPYGLVALVMAAAIVQWASPWQPPAPALPKRLRLRCAS